MKKILFIILILYCLPIHSNTVEVIELHENKSLDQLVLDQLIEDEEIKENNSINTVEENTVDENNSESNVSNEVIVEEENIELKDNYFTLLQKSKVNNILNNSKNIKSNILKKQLNEFLLNLSFDFEDKNHRDIHFQIINYFYDTGNLSNAYQMSKLLDLENNENIGFYKSIELNYLLSTFQLEEVCNFKESSNLNFSLENNFLEKIDVFCLILEDKNSEAELLNSIMQETQDSEDLNFQNLFNWMLNNNKEIENSEFKLDKNIKKELIFLYSAMARIAELPLTEEFLKVDSNNLAIPIILNKSVPIELRLKAANQSFNNNMIQIESLAALYRSVDFNSSQFNKPEDTINALSNNINIIMAYYFQLINIQIFPSERLDVMLDFWKFAKENNLEKIAYSLSYKIIDSIEMSSDYIKFGPQISIAYIYNSDFDKALNWINFYENALGVDDKSSYARLLLNLQLSKDLNSIIEIINLNYNKFSNLENKKIEEIIFIIFDVLDSSHDKKLNEDFSELNDHRLIPPMFVIQNIGDSILNNDDVKLLIYSIISLNSNNWQDIHPIHLQLILKGFINYKDGEYLNDIILEIFEDYKIL